MRTRRPSRARRTTWVRAVEAAPEAGPLITDITGTQPQRKLGPYIDTVLTVQFLSRVVENLPAGSDRMKRVRGALEGCVRKLQAAQTGDGSWGADRGWAPVLQSSLATSALEMASVAETDVNPESLNRARDYQKGRFDVASGRASGEGVAGVELYSLASAKRANAARARYAMSAIEEAKAKGDLPDDAAVSEENLDAAGVPADVVGGLVGVVSRSRSTRGQACERRRPLARFRLERGRGISQLSTDERGARD